MKRCARCEALKDEQDFSKDTRRKDGRKSYCKACERLSKAAQRINRKDSIQQSNKTYWHRNKKRINRNRRIIYKLKPYAGKMPAWKVGESLNISEKWANELARRVGISLAYYKERWSEEETEELMRMRSQGVTIKQCAININRSHEAVKAKLNELRNKR